MCATPVCGDPSTEAGRFVTSPRGETTQAWLAAVWSPSKRGWPLCDIPVWGDHSSVAGRCVETFHVWLATVGHPRVERPRKRGWPRAGIPVWGYLDQPYGWLH